jgi:hypothetical protein
VVDAVAIDQASVRGGILWRSFGQNLFAPQGPPTSWVKAGCVSGGTKASLFERATAILELGACESLRIGAKMGKSFLTLAFTANSAWSTGASCPLSS